MKFSKHIIILAIFLLCLSYIFAQDSYRSTFSYLSPLPESRHILPEQKVSFRLQKDLAPDAVGQIFIELVGSVSGNINGVLHQAKDGRTFIFSPNKKFAHGEELQLFIQFSKDSELEDFSTKFYTTNLTYDVRQNVLSEIYKKENTVPSSVGTITNAIHKNVKATNDSLPEGFPDITITHWDNPSSGNIFVSPLNYVDNKYYMIMLDNYATPVFYQQLEGNGGTDFKLQPNGFLTIFLYALNKYAVYNSQFIAIDTIGAGNGYTADLHELRYYPDGSAFLLAYDPQIVDMSEVVPGGQEDAIVVGLIVQELNSEKEVVFQWRSWDHYQITDASNWVDLTGSPVDYVHGNSIEVKNENELMICSRNMNEITNIDRNTGDIIWRLNGENNMFEFIQPEDSFCVQHSIRMMPDSTNISLFDNGGCWDPKRSSAVEFSLDVENFTCTQVSRFRSDPDIFGSFMGNTQRLLNGHAINGWGSGIPSVTEFDEEGNILLQFSFPHLNYRAFKFDWQHTVFSIEEQSIDFGTIPYQDSAYASVTLVNHLSEELSINRVVNHKPQYSITNSLPIVLPANGEVEVEVKFLPGVSLKFDDVLSFCWDIFSDSLNRRICSQVSVTGEAIGNEGVDELNAAGFKVYPNPFEGVLSIESSSLKMEKIMVFNQEGKEVKAIEAFGNKFMQLQLNSPPGAYFILIQAEDGKSYSGKILKRQ